MSEARTAPDLPEGWLDVVLGDLGEFSTSSVDKKVNTTELPVRLVNYMDVYRSPYLSSQSDFMLVTASRSEISKSQVLKGDLLFTPSSETPDDVGHSAVVVEALPETLHSYHTVRFRIAASQEVDLRFRGRFANSAQVLKHFEKCATGSTRYTLSLADFRSAPVRIPPVAEQAKIALVLDTLDVTIRQTEAIIEKLKQVKQGLLHDLLTRGVDVNGELRPPQIQAPHLYKDSPLGWIPKEWDFAPVGSMADIVYGINDAIEMGLDEGIRTITLPCVSASGDLSLASNNLVFTAPRKVPEALLLRRGDLLFNWRNGSLNHLGKTAYFNDDGVYTHVGFLLRVRARAEICLPEFLCAALRYAKDTGVFLRAKGQVNNTFNSDELRSLSLAFPGVNEQAVICARLDALERVAVVERATLAKLSVQKSGLMDDLLTGRVRVTPLLDAATRS